jgi:subtilisin-like proprotein convertase family protein
VATVRTFIDSDSNGTYETLAGVLQPFGASRGGVRVATGDFDGDGNDELVTATGAGGTVKIWSLNSDGSVGGVKESFLPFGAAFKGGLFVAAGDLDGDGKDELAVSQGSGGNAIRVFSDTDGDAFVGDALTDSFNPFGGFLGGSRLAIGDTNNLGGDDLIVGRGPGGPTTVRVYTDGDADRQVSDAPALESFLPFGSAYTGGVYVASGAIESVGNGGAEVIVGRGTGASVVRIFTDTNASGKVGDEAPFETFHAQPGSTGGVRVAAGDTDNSNFFVEVITASGPGGGRVTIRDDTGDAGLLVSDNVADDNFAAFGASYTKGLFAAFGKVQNTTYSYQGFPTTIPDQATVTSTIVVPPGAGKIKDLDVTLAIAHTFVGDLDITLTHVPSGTSVTLFTDIGGTDAGLFVRLNDEAGTDIGSADNPDGEYISGTFNPEGTAALSVFDGLDASGEWQLTITDDTAADLGVLYGWSLAFTF